MTPKLTFYSLLLTLLCSLTSFAQEWNTDIETAKKIAATKNQPVLLVFQGSDWCAPCIKLDRAVWSSDTFKAYASKNLTLILADFPRKKKNFLSPEQTKKNKALAATYNPKGFFPFVVILNAEGKVKGTTSYLKATPEEYIKHLETFY